MFWKFELLEFIKKGTDLFNIDLKAFSSFQTEYIMVKYLITI